MKWFDIEKDDLKLSFCIAGYDDLDGYVTFDSIEVRKGDSIIFSLYNERILENNDVDDLIHISDMLLKKIPGKDTLLDFDVFDFRFFLETANDISMEMRVYPGTVISDGYPLEYERSGEYHGFFFSIEDVRRFREYLFLVSHWYLHTMDYVKGGIARLGYRWCVVGNIIETRIDEETGTVYHGTKLFPPKGRVYIYPDQGDDLDEVSIIGRARKSHTLAEDVVPLKFIEDLRIQKEYHPYILDYMDHHSFLWYTNSKADAMKAHMLLLELKRKKDE